MIEDTGINRNIMECKDEIIRSKFSVFDSVLIETLWNVKRNRIEPKLFGNFGINRNIMECKDQLTRIGYGHILY